MGKEYFSHDCNTRNKKKMGHLIHEEKMKGYGLFWIIVEILHETSENWLELEKSSYIAIAKESGLQENFVKEFIFRCINEYKVFIEEGGKFSTERVLANIDRRNSISESRSKAGKASAAVRQKATNSEQVLTEIEQTPTIKGKESKLKESKEEGTLFLKSDFDISLSLPPHTLEAVEMNQHTNTGKKNTDFVKSQWKLFLYERLNDSPEKKRQFQRLPDLYSYFINWMRPKFPNKFNPSETPNNGKLTVIEQDGQNIINKALNKSNGN